MRKVVATIVLAGWLLGAWSASAAPLMIVALGASNTAGRGIGSHPGGVAAKDAYPAQLEALLRAKGYDAHVRNAGVPGDTTAGMLRRMNTAVPNGTQIVILQVGGNDARQGVGADTAANTARMKSQLSGRGIKVILLDKLGAFAPESTRDSDGQHYNVQGHAAIAAGLQPQVIAAIGTEP
jgi:acyl-CoA thioesterase-1